MKLKIKNNLSMRYFWVIIVSFTLVFSIAKANNLALSESEQAELLRQEDELSKLEKEEKILQQSININQSRQSELGNHLNALNNEIADIEKNKKDIEKNITDLNFEIGDLQEKIKTKAEVMEIQKELLKKLIRAYYEEQKKGIFSVVLNGGLSDFMIKKDRVTQVSDKINSVLNNLQMAKVSLENEHRAIENKKNKIIEAKGELEEKNYHLVSTKTQKQNLLVRTQGEEERYKQMLARVNEQKQQLLGDINELYIANSVEINTLLENLPRPTYGLASRSWYYSQKDNRWGTTTIGQSNSYMKDYGCAIASVAMVFTHHGKSITPGSLAKQPIFYWDLIVWPSSWQGINLITNTYRSGVNWKTVDRELEMGNPVIVFVKATSVPRSGHYVVVHGKDKNGKYVVHDPYFGANIYLESTIKLLSSLYKVSISQNAVDQMILYK